MYTLKSIATRGTALGAAFALVAAAVVPTASVFASSLNPLTERSLLLTSSAPGYVDTDGSNYSAANPNPAAGGNTPTNYAPAGSGPNGKKSGQTFKFNHSTAANIQGISLQYCTSAAGFCQAPGNNTGDARVLDHTTNSGEPGYNADDYTTWGDSEDWDTRVANRQANADAHAASLSDLDFVGDFANGTTAGQFEVRVGGVTSPGWTFAKTNLESIYHTGAHTGKNNYVTLVNTGDVAIAKGQEVQVIFRPSESIYITNPGSSEFFVKINTYSSNTNLVGSHNDATPLDPSDTPSHTVVNGGVTVANVMTDSIHITTKVLETMAFSVGTSNRDTVNLTNPSVHGTCDPIIQDNNNRLNLGNPNAEYSLETRQAYDVNSYWRLSSNSSGGATVYYSGNTLSNTVGDFIDDMPTAAVSTPGTEQFGLGFVDANADTKSASFLAQQAAAPTRFKDPSSFPFITVAGQEELDLPEERDFTSLAAQPVSTDYRNATGAITGANGTPGAAVFKFNKTSQTIPEPIAQQNETVISCATAKMRYVANIGADTPAGVYTTKINYLAAPQY